MRPPTKKGKLYSEIIHNLQQRSTQNLSDLERKAGTKNNIAEQDAIMLDSRSAFKYEPRGLLLHQQVRSCHALRGYPSSERHECSLGAGDAGEEKY